MSVFKEIIENRIGWESIDQENYEEIVFEIDRHFKLMLKQLYKECEHGDDEHRKWLKDKFDDFYKRMTDEQTDLYFST